ncbi:13207_t:CDS:2, partial [Acaulospora colombiana]
CSRNKTLPVDKPSCEIGAYEAFWFLPEKRRVPHDFNYTDGMIPDWDSGLNGSLGSHSQSGFGDSYGKGPMGGPDSAGKRNRSESNPENNLSSAWISLLFALLCVAMERLGFYDSKALGIVEEVEDYKRLCKSLFEASQTIMVLGNFLNSKVLHLHCQQSVAETNWETHTAVTIAAAARIGNMMGLNKLIPEKLGPARAPGFLKREATRDSFEQFDPEAKGNMDGGHCQGEPGTGAWIYHWFCILLSSSIQLDRYNSPEGVSYTLLLNHHAQLEQSQSRIPSSLIHLDGDLEHTNTQVQNHENEEKASHTRSTSVYTNSLEASLRSAETILDTIEEAKALDYPGVQWWQTTLYCYVAAVVLLAERWYTSEAKPGSLKSEDAEERKRKIVAAIALLRDQGESIDLFSEAANTLDSLLDATTSARRKARRSSSKRGMDITDVVNPINIPSRPGSNASTPSFVREWIERPNTPLSPPRLLPEHERSLSTVSLAPGVALTADNSFDSHFWARVFDLQFGSPVATPDPFFP